MLSDILAGVLVQHTKATPCNAWLWPRSASTKGTGSP